MDAAAIEREVRSPPVAERAVLADSTFTNAAQ